MKRIFLIHGWGGSPEEGWTPWLKGKLEKRGFEVYVPAMSDSKHPRMDAWLANLRETVRVPDQNCYFVGHSLGCITILRYLETLEENQKVGGAVLVAGFSDINITVGPDENVLEIQSFFQTNVDFAAIRKHCDKFVAIHSDNDPYVDLRYADIFRENLGAKVLVEKHKGHFSGDDGIMELPSALENTLQLASD
ncbi:MAG: serine hydrolase family protein [Candidatus Wildermuthbacteria bacterium]|nr:serine hydrolase family protein [Candidatus Wildermuthbacteria bacterium]